MATAPTVFERTHNQNKEPIRYFTPTAVGAHFKRSPASILSDFQSGKVQALELGDYTYKPTSSRPGPMIQAGQPSGLDKMEPLQEARKSATLDLTPKQKAEGAAAMVAAKRLAKEDPKNLTRDQLADAHNRQMEQAEAVAKSGRQEPIKKAADDFSHEEWTGMKPLDKPAPDREKFLQTGEVSPEASKKQGWWDRMKERLRFKRSDTDEDKKSDEEEAQRIADEQKQEHLGRLIRREKLPGYDAWKLASPDDKPVKKSANGEEDMEQTGGTHIDAGHVDVSIKKSRRADGSVDHLTH